MKIKSLFHWGRHEQSMGITIGTNKTLFPRPTGAVPLDYYIKWYRSSYRGYRATGFMWRVFKKHRHLAISGVKIYQGYWGYRYHEELGLHCFGFYALELCFA